MRSRVMDGGELAVALHILRIARGWKQSELVAAAGLSSAAVSYYESGKRVPELQTLRAILEAMGYQLSTLDDARAFIRQVRSGEVPADTSARLLALEVGQAVTRFAAALLEARK